MILLKGAEVSSKIKAEVLEAVSAMEGHVPTAAIVRVGERPDDVSYEKNAMKKIKVLYLFSLYKCQEVKVYSFYI